MARSKELASVSVLVIGAVSLMWFGESLAKALYALMTRLFSLNREEIFDLTKLFDILSGSLTSLILPTLIILIILFIAAFIGSIGVGEFLFQLKPPGPSFLR